MKYLLLLNILYGCSNYNTRESEKYDFMFTLADGTWVCDKYNIGGFYEDCEHGLTGKKSDKITIGIDVSVIRVSEGTI